MYVKHLGTNVALDEIECHAEKSKYDSVTPF